VERFPPFHGPSLLLEILHVSSRSTWPPPRPPVFFFRTYLSGILADGHLALSPFFPTAGGDPPISLLLLYPSLEPQGREGVCRSRSLFGHSRSRKRIPVSDFFISTGELPAGRTHGVGRMCGRFLGVVWPRLFSQFSSSREDPLRIKTSMQALLREFPPLCLFSGNVPFSPLRLFSF